MRVRQEIVLPVVLVLSALGCNKSPRERLEGKWVGEGIAQVHASQDGRADEWAKQTRVEFNGNNVTVAIPAEEPRSGTFKIAKATGNDLQVVFKRKAGGEDTSRLTFVEDDKLRWTFDNGVEVMLRRE